MKKKILGYCLLSSFPLFLLLANGCSKEEKKLNYSGHKKPLESSKITVSDSPDKMETSTELKKDITDFVPDGYNMTEKSFGDLNKDGTEDCIMIIKKIDPANIVNDKYRGKLDRNRRGIIVLFKKEGGYELASENRNCFSSENEDGGVYYAPELLVSAEKGNLKVHYAHGRYGYWNYTFRSTHSDFELIGYDMSSNTGPRVNSMTSINFLTGKRLDKTNVAEGDDDEVFEDQWTKIKPMKPITLSGVKDFDELDFTSPN